MMFWHALCTRYTIRVNNTGGRGCITVCPLPQDPMPTLNWVFENQPIASGKLTQPSRYKRVESNLLADKKGPPDTSII